MKILLLGEYSRLHNSLKEGLTALGHEVTLLGTGDYFKNFPADIKLKRKFDKGLMRKIKIALFNFFGIDITSNNLKNQFFKHSEKLKGFDVVQLINESPLGIQPKHEIEIIRFLKNHNKKLFLLSCGTDHISVKYGFEKKFRYSILTPLFEDKVDEKAFFPVLKYLHPEFKKLHQFVYKNTEGVLASDMDYHLPLIDHPKYLGLIPNPINTDKLAFLENPIQNKIVIFHGINRGNFYKKGNDLFQKAIQIIQEKYPDKTEIIVVENLPYTEYIKLYDKAHILLDQVYAYDQGYNALEAMAKGKVVFTGAEKEFLEHYNLQADEVCINALPDVDALVEKLSWLIENPEEINRIGQNARVFIEREHHYVKIAQKYLDVWNQH
jgi:glycosyltransferase involved in cell wall biosynthesis